MNLRALLIFLFLNFVYSSSFGQSATLKQGKRIELLHANSLEVDDKLGQGAKRLIGNVSLKHENAIMDCDSAYLYSTNILDAFGHVHIHQGDTVNLYGDKLKYNGDDKRADVTGNVRMQDKDMTLTTDQLFYDLNSNTASYSTGGKITSKDNVLTSRLGSYYSANKEFHFKKDVVLVNPQYTINCDTLHYNGAIKTSFFIGPTTIKSKENLIYCENGWYNTSTDKSQFNKNAYIITKKQKLKGDSLFYDRKAAYGKAIKHIEIIDTAQKIVINGDLAEFYEKIEKSVVTQNAVMMQQYSSDTLFLHADSLVGGYTGYLDISKNKADNVELASDLKKEQKRLILAYKKVQFYKSDMQGRCDSLSYAFNDSIMRLYHEPVLWSGLNQVTGSRIDLKTGSGELRSLYIPSNAFIASQEDSLHFNQVKGKTLFGTFKSSKLYKVRIEGNGETVYYGKEKGKYIGVNKAQCSNMILFLKENKIDKITFITKPNAILYPVNELPASELLLKDLKWKITLKPRSKADIFKW